MLCFLLSFGVTCWTSESAVEFWVISLHNGNRPATKGHLTLIPTPRISRCLRM